MDPDDRRRLTRLFAGLCIFTLLIIIGFVFWASFELRRLKFAIAASDTIQPIQPLNGINGLDGRDGLPGAPGKDSVSTYTLQVTEKPTIIEKVVSGPEGPQGLQGLPGPQGEPGPAGADARELEFGVRAGLPVWRYAGDKEWQEFVEVDMELP